MKISLPMAWRGRMFVAMIAVVSIVGCAAPTATPIPARVLQATVPAAVAVVSPTKALPQAAAPTNVAIAQATRVSEPTQAPVLVQASVTSRPLEATKAPTSAGEGRPSGGVSPTDALVQGRWQQSKVSSGSSSFSMAALAFGPIDSLEFLQNGIVALYSTWLISTTVGATYSFTQDGWIKLNTKGSEYAFKCSLAGDKLTFYGDGNDYYEYTRVRTLPSGIPAPAAVASLRTSILGKWEVTTPEDARAPQLQLLVDMCEQWEFLQNGIVTLNCALVGSRSGTYTFPQNGWVSITLGADLLAIRVSVSGNKMTWYDGNGATVEFAKAG